MRRIFRLHRVDKLPVETFFIVVIVNGAASAEILDFNIVISVVCDDYFIAEACARFVYGV